MVSGTDLGRSAKEGDSPVRENQNEWVRHLSSTGHEEPCVNPGGPPPKAKYYLATDSEPVP